NMSREHCQLRARSGVPYTGRPVLARCDYLCAIRAEDGTADHADMLLKQCQLLARDSVPHARGRICTCRYEARAIDAEGPTEQGASMSAQNGHKSTTV